MTMRSLRFTAVPAPGLPDEDFPDEAIRYLISGGDHVAAEQIVQQYRYALMNSEQWPRLEHWLRHFPDETRESRAMLMSTTAVLTMHTGQYQEMVISAQRAEALLANLPPESPAFNAVLGEASVIAASVALVNGNTGALTTSAQRALHLLPSDALLLRAIACGAIAADMQMSGQYADGCRFLEETINSSQWTQSIRTKLMIYLCLVSFMQGDLTTTQAWAERVKQIAEERHLAESLCIARHFLGVTHYLRHELNAAEPFLRGLVEDSAGSAQSHMSMGAFALTLIHDSRGDFTRANVIIEGLVTYFQDTDNAFALALIEAFTVELALRRGNVGAAQRKRIGVDFDRRPPIWFFYLPQLTPIKLLLADRTPEALHVARTALDEFEQRMLAT